METPKNSSPETIKFRDYYHTADIVILAEDIGHGKHLQEILAFLDQFHNQLSGLFFEDTINRQSSFDRYIETGEIDDNLSYLFEGAKREGKDLQTETLALLDKAKQYGVPIICYDASKEQSDKSPKKAKHGHWFIKGECRDEDMFNNVQNYYQSHPGKYVIVIGSHHMTDENFEGNYKNFGPRMKEKFGDKCIAVKMSDSPDKEDIYDDVIVINS
jgi:hypothetical protein